MVRINVAGLMWVLLIPGFLGFAFVKCCDIVCCLCGCWFWVCQCGGFLWFGFLVGFVILVVGFGV